MTSVTMEPYDPDREPVAEEAMDKIARQAAIIEQLGTELHALIMVLADKKLLTLSDVRAAQRRLNLAAEVASVRHLDLVSRDLQRLDADLDRPDSL